MSRPRHIWFYFGLCLTVLLTAMGWVSWTALRLDDAQRRVAQQAELEEKVRLALWRMDSALAPMILEESARPYQNYDPFPTVSRAYKKGGSSYPEGDVLAPSPLLSFTPGHVLLHFQFEPNGPLTSPQVPAGPQRALAEKNYTTAESIKAAAQRLGQLQQLLDEPGAVAPPGPSTTLFRSARSRSYLSESAANRELLVQRASTATNQTPAIGSLEATRPTAELSPAPLAKKSQAASMPQAQQQRSQAELTARNSIYQQVQQRASQANDMMSNVSAALSPRAKEGLFAPVWLGTELVLVRRIDLENRFLIQGCWLDWGSLKKSLLASVADLLPHGDLEPAQNTQGSLAARTLASLPAKLLTGPAQLAPLPPWSPVRLSLVVAWACMLLAGAAVALLLHGTLSLSERRAAFVSAVTHELRTPLTTFKMYSEMLAAEMIPDEHKRRQYLNTLCAEANRLGHLVENVLAYARLERGSARQRVEVVSLQQLLDRVKDRLEQRAEQTGLNLEVETSPETLRTPIRADVSAVEQILFNLVDNACKYAAPGALDARLHLEVVCAGKVALLRVRDHGPGIQPREAKRLFEPFHKSAHEAAHSAPGVGLGLALCRCLSRAMGGDLRLDRGADAGACFVLELPVGTAATRV